MMLTRTLLLAISLALVSAQSSQEAAQTIGDVHSSTTVNTPQPSQQSSHNPQHSTDASHTTAQPTFAPSAPASPSVTAPPASNGARLNVPPQMPAAWPDVSESKMIDGAFLEDPLVTQAWAYVQSVVPKSVLDVPPSQYVSGSTTKYGADAVANCYWPNNLCTRSTDAAYYHADISTCPGDNVWGITYDDGPINNSGTDDTSALLTSLKDANVQATFFCVGSNVVQFPADVKRALDAGHEIASHTWTHHPLTSLTNLQVIAEIKYTEAIIYNATGIVPAMIRPPYGDVDDRVRAIMWALGYRNVLWTTTPDRDTHDADGSEGETASQEIVDLVKNQFFTPQPGFISLEHDISTFTTSVAIKILQAIQAAKASSMLSIDVTAVGKCTNKPVYQNAAPLPSPAAPTTTQASSGPTPPATGGKTINIPDAKAATSSAVGGYGLSVVLVTVCGVVAAVLGYVN